jgi:uncharacterized membrane protein YeaQ/YmgE (transglycosylase-associated protein family)
MQGHAMYASCLRLGAQVAVGKTGVWVIPASNSTDTKEEISMGHGWIAWIIIGVIAGWLTGKLMKGSGFGFFMDMIVGLVGALIGGFLSSHLGLGGVGQHGMIISIVIAVIGAIILTWILRLISGNRGANL